MDLQSYIQLKEAYTNLHAPKVEVSNELVEAWVHHLVEEEGLDLSDMTWDEVREAYLDEQGGNNAMRLKLQKNRENVKAAQPKPAPAASSSFSARRNARRSASPAAQANTNSVGQNIKTTKPAPAKPAPAKAQPQAAKPQPQAAPPKAKPAPKPAAQTGNKAADMKSWATANPKLAAAKAKRDSSRGTSATTNPLMKDLAKRMPKPAAPKPSAAPKPTATAKPMSRIAKATSNVKPMKPMKEDFDVVLEHLIQSGFATEDALKLMVNMSQEKLDTIIGEKLETGAEYHDRMKNKEMPWKKPNATKATATPEMKAKLDAKEGEKKPEAKKDSRTDAEKMADATGPRKGSNYRGD